MARGEQGEQLYLSLGHDALAKVAEEWDQDLKRGARLRRLVAAVAGMAILALVMAGLAGFSWWQWREAEDRRKKEKIAQEERTKPENLANDERRKGERLKEEGEKREEIIYASKIRQAQNASDNSLVKADILWQLHPRLKPELEYRGFEWHHLWRRTRLHVPPLRGHVAPVRKIAWPPDGRRLATHGQDNRTCLWDVDSGRKVIARTGLGNVPEVLGWSSDG
jgi:hypothetical protein